MNENLVIGKRSVLETLQSRRACVVRLLVAISASDKRVAAAIRAARRNGIEVSFVEKKYLDELSNGGNHQGLAAEIERANIVSLPEIIANSVSSKTPSLLVVLDHIEDPHNLGAIIRTSEIAGAHGLIIPSRRAAGITPVVTKVASGATAYLPIAVVSNIAQTIDRLKSSGIWCVGLTVNANTIIYDVDFRQPTAVVIGNENKGIHRLVAEKCDLLATIPMAGKTGSLNASVAAGVVLFEIVRQRSYAP